MREGDRYRLDHDRPQSVGKVREFWGNVPQVVKAYAWARAMGADGIHEASDLSVLANNYMEKRLLEIRGVTRSHPDIDERRLEMTRWSLGELKEETGVGAVDVANRMADYGIDAPWLSHEPWVVPGAVHAGSRRDVVEGGHRLLDRRARPGLPRGARGPRARPLGAAQPGRPQAGDVSLDDPEVWATTWRAYRRKHASRDRMTDVSGRTVLVTGASKGIGAEIAAVLGRAGANVVAHYGSDRAGAEAATAAIPDERKLLVGADLIDPGAREPALE